MHKLKWSILLIGCVIAYGHVNGQENRTTPEKSLAVILKISGNGHLINEVNTSLVKIFEGHTNVTYERTSTTTDDVIRVKAFGAKGNLIFDGYVDNPLVENKESFEKDGTARNTTVVSTTGSVSLRFPFQGVPGNITLQCYQIIDGEEEKLIKTLNFNER